jgi:hypothetical protein
MGPTKIRMLQGRRPRRPPRAPLAIAPRGAGRRAPRGKTRSAGAGSQCEASRAGARAPPRARPLTGLAWEGAAAHRPGHGRARPLRGRGTGGRGRSQAGHGEGGGQRLHLLPQRLDVGPLGAVGLQVCLELLELAGGGGLGLGGKGGGSVGRAGRDGTGGSRPWAGGRVRWGWGGRAGTVAAGAPAVELASTAPLAFPPSFAIIGKSLMLTSCWKGANKHKQKPHLAVLGDVHGAANEVRHLAVNGAVNGTVKGRSNRQSTGGVWRRALGAAPKAGAPATPRSQAQGPGLGATKPPPARRGPGAAPSQTRPPQSRAWSARACRCACRRAPSRSCRRGRCSY